jgi:hypothetical protein
MKNVFGVEWFNKQADFDEAIEKVKALLKDGEESEIVYIREEGEKCHEVLVRGYFVPPPAISIDSKMIPTIWWNYDMLLILNLKVKKDKEEKLLT